MTRLPVWALFLIPVVLLGLIILSLPVFLVAAGAFTLLSMFKKPATLQAPTAGDFLDQKAIHRNERSLDPTITDLSF